MKRLLFVFIKIFFSYTFFAQPFCDCDSIKDNKNYKGFCTEYIDMHWQVVKKNMASFKRYKYYSSGGEKKLYGKENFLTKMKLYLNNQPVKREHGIKLLNGTYQWYGKYQNLYEEFNYIEGKLTKLIDYRKSGCNQGYYFLVKNIAEYDYTISPLCLHYMVFEKEKLTENVKWRLENKIWKKEPTIELLTLDLDDLRPKKIYDKKDTVCNSIADAFMSQTTVLYLNLNGPILGWEKEMKGSIIPVEVGFLTNLTHLNAYNSMLESVPASIGNLIKLEHLFLSSNNLKDLPTSVANLSSLKFISLMDNKFKKFPISITKLLSLEKIHFQSNLITEIPKEIGNLKKLKDITFYANYNLKTVPKEIGELTSLESLNFGNCVQLKSLPDEIKKLKNLTYLNLSFTKIPLKKIEEIKQALPNCKIECLKKSDL